MCSTDLLKIDHSLSVRRATVTVMAKGRKSEHSTIARAKASANRARAIRKAVISGLCNQALAAKTPLDVESTVAALRVAVKHL